MRRYAILVLLCALAGCAVRSGTANIPVPSNGSPLDVSAPRKLGAAASKIQHVVVVIQENRSFDNLFYGYPGADTATSGQNSKGQTITLAPVSFTATYDLGHLAQDYFAACDGTQGLPGTNCRMDGFDLESVYGSTPANPQYAYVPHNETKLYFEMAHRYVLADRMFTSHVDASFVSHQYIIAAHARHAVNLPTLGWGCGGGNGDAVATLRANRTTGHGETPCFDYQTIGDELDAKNLPWRFYAAAFGQSGYIWSSYQAVDHIRNGADWQKDVISPPGQFLTDVASGSLAAVTWVTPTFTDSDHGNSATGPQWVASVVNAVGESPFWDSTAIFVMWDEWGGWYDHVPPPYADYDGLGVRVPLLVISPYAKRGHVSHVQYEHGSILKYIENVFGLASLAASDARANALDGDCFDYNRKPRAFVPFASSRSPAAFRSERVDLRAPDAE